MGSVSRLTLNNANSVIATCSQMPTPCPLTDVFPDWSCNFRLVQRCQAIQLGRRVLAAHFGPPISLDFNENLFEVMKVRHLFGLHLIEPQQTPQLPEARIE